MTSPVSRRRFVEAALGAAAGSAILAACTDDGNDAAGTPTSVDPFERTASGDLPVIEWAMATSWPTSHGVVHGAAEFLAEQVARITDNRLRIDPAPAGEIVSAREILQNVGSGKVALGFTESSFYAGLDPILDLATGIPFGLTTRQQQSWLHGGDGLDLLRPIFRDRFGVVNFPAGTTGCQMGGWFNREIASVEDLAGLRMRIRGLGAAALAQLGVSVELVPDDETVESLAAGTLDAAVGVGPHDDVERGLHRVGAYYLYPGWWAPGPSLDLLVHAERYDRLPEPYKAALDVASRSTATHMLTTYDTLNPPALATIQAGDVVVAPFPDDVIRAASAEVDRIVAETAAADPSYRIVLDSYLDYRAAVLSWHGLAEQAMLDQLIG